MLKRVFILIMSIPYVLSSCKKKIIEKFDEPENILDKLSRIKQDIISGGIVVNKS